jgi:dTDP-4-dehydrorhamnose reductase
MSSGIQTVKLMNVLIMGSKGMLGKAFIRSTGHNFNIIPASREDFDFTDRDRLYEFLDLKRPVVVVNAAANINLADCENNPVSSSKINVRFVHDLSAWCALNETILVHISTDHFYDYGNDLSHIETDEVKLLNEYSRQKYRAEQIALEASNSLVLRTSILGYRYSGGKTFVEWILSTIKNEKSISGFVDAYTSSIDVNSFVHIVFLCIEQGLSGVYNIGTSEVYSKYNLIQEIIVRLGYPDVQLKSAKASQLSPKRANCCGLDVGKLERSLGISLPTLGMVVDKLYIQENYNEI